MPNLEKAPQGLAKNQTQVNLALLACALESHRKARGAYPESLDALAPQFVDKVPHDLVTGQPLKYRRTPDGRYHLYSVGWDLKDDGGPAGAAKSPGDSSQGDWSWKGVPGR